MDNANVIATINTLCVQYAENIAIRWDKGLYSFAQLSECLNQLDALLAPYVRTGSRVGLLISDRRIFALSILAFMRNYSVVPLNPSYSKSELIDYSQRMSVDLLLVDAASLDMVDLNKLGALPLAQLNFDLESTAAKIELIPKRDAKIRSSNVCSEKSFDRESYPALILHTSGSTAEPKVIALNHDALIESSKYLRLSLELQKTDCCLSALPMFHIGAVVDLLLGPLLSGGSVYLANDSRAATFFDILLNEPVTWYQGVPTMLQEIMHTHNGRVIPLKLRFIRSVSSHLPKILENGISALFQVPVIEIYGMSETAGVICSNGFNPEARKSGSVGRPCGPELKVVDETFLEVAVGHVGEIVVKGRSVIKRYEKPESINGSSFIGDWLRTGDLGYRDKDGFLFLTGRLKEMINRGGEKIAPLQIDEIACQFPGVKEAAAFARAHYTLGEEVALAVVSASDEVLDQDRLKAFMREHLAEYKIPHCIFQINELPRKPGGKLERYKLSSLTADNKNNSQFWDEFNFFELKLASSWKKVLHLNKLRKDDDFFGLGGDSLSALNLIEEIHSSLGVYVSAQNLFDAPKFDQFCSLVSSLQGSNAKGVNEVELPCGILRQLEHFLDFSGGHRCGKNSLVVEWPIELEKPNLFWISQGGGDVLQKNIEQSFKLYLMRTLFKIDGRSDDLNDKIAEIYALEINRIQAEGPITLGGFCEGAKIGLLVASKLSEISRELKLFISADYVPTAYQFYGPARFYFSYYWSRKNHPIHSTAEFRAGIQGKTVSIMEYDSVHSGLMNKTEFLDDLSRNANLRSFEFPIADSSGPNCTSSLRIDARVSRFLEPARKIDLRLTVNNIGITEFEPPETCVLQVRWSNREGLYRDDEETNFPFTKKLGTDEVLNVNLLITTPHKPCRRTLEIEILSDRHQWFSGYRYSVALQFKVTIHPVAKFLKWFPSSPVFIKV